MAWQHPISTFYENGKDHHLIRFVLQKTTLLGRSGKTTMQNLIP
jgi:hypothetical protein